MRWESILIFIISLLSFLSSNQVRAGWTLTFSDDFNAQTKIDTNKWNLFYKFSPDVINKELQFYAPDAFTFTPTAMRIQAERRVVRVNRSPYTFNYTSGAITTFHKFNQTYGYYEMRAKVPAGRGYWPAFWLLPENQDSDGSQEIDIMEMVMHAPNSVHTTFHCNYSTGGARGKETRYTNFNLTAYHTFGLQWVPNLLIWYVDGVQVWNFSSPCVPNKPAYILANLAVGGEWPGPPDASTPFPGIFEIDYIRAYRYTSSGASIPGPGAGRSYTPLSDQIPSLRLRNPRSSPETVTGVGQRVNVSVTVVSDATALTNILVRFTFYNGTFHDIGSITQTVTVPAYSTRTVQSTYTIPSNAPSGTYVTWMTGIWTASYGQLLVWETNGIIGVNKVVGRR